MLYTETEWARAIAGDLCTMRLDEPFSITHALPAMAEFLGLETLLVFSPCERVVGWGLDRFEATNIPSAHRLRRLLRDHLEKGRHEYAFFDLLRPPARERDRVVELGARPTCTADSVFRRDVLAPVGLDRHRQLRTLVCDRDATLAWFGALHDGEFTPLQRRKLRALLPPLRHRLSVERLLKRSKLVHAALDMILDQIGSACFLLGAKHEIVFANPRGRGLLRAARQETLRTLERAVRQPCRGDVEVIRLASRGAPALTLVVLRPESDETRIDSCVAAAAARWRLTPKQREVLRLVALGQMNNEIAYTMGISERAVELHITAIFDKLGVDNRTALVARTLLTA